MHSNLTIELVAARQAEAALARPLHELPAKRRRRLGLVLPTRAPRRRKIAHA